MNYKEYRDLYKKLNSPEDVARLIENTDYDEKLLNVIYTQKTIRETTKRFYKVKRHTSKMLKKWKNGKSLLEIADEYDFSPIMTSMFILREHGFSKKKFWEYVRNPGDIQDERLKKEILDVYLADFVYSPWANKQQHERGEWGEELLTDWLDKHDISYKTEEDLRGDYPKTPDCLFDEPVKINGWEINWIESKASFGDSVEIRKNIKGQLDPYLDLFGEGMVVYWLGHVDNFKCPEGIALTDDTILNWECKKQ